eukprot:2797711-Pleurochrysis_carterae.AAC.1
MGEKPSVSIASLPRASLARNALLCRAPRHPRPVAQGRVSERSAICTTPQRARRRSEVSRYGVPSLNQLFSS